MTDYEQVAGFETGTASVPFDAVSGRSPVTASPSGRYSMALAEDRGVYLEWRWTPEEFDRIGEHPVDQAIHSDDLVRVRLWLDDDGVLRLRLGSWTDSER